MKGEKIMVKEILLLGNTQLYEISKEVQKGENLTELIQNLRDKLLDYRKKYHKGRAIAAPQIGVKKRVIYFYTDKEIVFINPILTISNNEKMEILDDCMSFPNLLVKVMRYKKCTITYMTPEWKQQKMELDGDLSELLQHEYDHLDGILATMKAIDNKSFYFKK